MTKPVAYARPTGLDMLRAPFLPHQISKLPKPTAAQTESVKKDFKTGIRCKVCGQWHHKDVVHLDYVGHAALTDRLLDCDPMWNWEPLAFNGAGSPVLDGNGGMWIRLTVCNVSRLGYGHADKKQGGDAIKEVIGDALRNAAMRFGAALDLWHKGDLHIADDQGDDDISPEPPTTPAKPDGGDIAGAVVAFDGASTLEELQGVWKGLEKAVQAHPKVIAAKDGAKERLKPADLGGDNIPY